MTVDLLSQSHTLIARPFTLVTALQKVRLAEDAWNSRDPKRVAMACSEDSVIWSAAIPFCRFAFRFCFWFFAFGLALR